MQPQFRKGDVATIEVTVDSNPFGMKDGSPKVKITFPPYHDAYVDPAQLTMARPNFRIGDTVELVAIGRFGAPVLGEVKAIDGDSLWVRRLTGGLDTWEMNRVRRADPDETQAADPDPVEPPPAPLDGNISIEVDREDAA